ncbi:3-deoxy-7-phosphoheptulonate synthase [Algisphaera agarilytica]|uniref:Phospho-2-dehydro-3-deoxyheptonate aldolase n=1 Tax=Algisphaera agarilytica TaxID=1385975 RepID=A0A7X0H8L9_9BACT|nr:3-deoxy-7-phosphoheptulonate synthase [Algisphaera agarilytica]MBB6429819.1 3-deoxy-7-phosphoheptulonate synthase [Algisphaera agarilytica]
MNTTPTTDPRPTQNLNVTSLDPLVPPATLEKSLPLSDRARQTVLDGRQSIEAILRGEDPRLLVVIGPCSIHDPAAAMEYAKKLAELKQKFDDRLFLVMRVYFEKPRTTVGWKGLINDPHLDGSFDITHGLNVARKLLIDINELGLPTGTEFLDPITPQYLDDLVSWAAIGARTTESQTHRQMASGLSMPVGFKNATNGSLQVALDAMQAALNPHHFIGVDEEGRASVVHTRGNAYGHVILRGGAQGSNYHPQDISATAEKLTSASMNPLLMVDCSHANSGKKFAQQEVVWDSLIEQRNAGGSGEAIIGVMIESNLFEGKQSIPDDLSQLQYGVSVTDECIGWEKTADMLQRGYDRLGLTD